MLSSMALRGAFKIIAKSRIWWVSAAVMPFIPSYAWAQGALLSATQQARQFSSICTGTMLMLSHLGWPPASCKGSCCKAAELHAQQRGHSTLTQMPGCIGRRWQSRQFTLALVTAIWAVLDRVELPVQHGDSLQWPVPMFSAGLSL